MIKPVMVIAGDGVKKSLILAVVKRFCKFRKMTHGSSKIKKVYVLKEDKRMRILKEDYNVESTSGLSRCVKLCSTIIVVYDYKQPDIKSFVKQCKKDGKKIHVYNTVGFSEKKKEED